jgi:hypothetical protein
MQAAATGDAPRGRALITLVRELEQHVAAQGWDAPWRLFALVRTADAIARDPELASRLPEEVVDAALADSEHLTAVEQEDLPDVPTVEAVLAQIAWPPTVDGAALVVERVVLPPSVEQTIPDDAADAAEYITEHPDRRDLRLAAAVLRDGTSGCAIRSRDHDADDRVALGATLVPALVEALAITLRDEPSAAAR